jgi:hypothetical protein
MPRYDDDEDDDDRDRDGRRRPRQRRQGRFQCPYCGTEEPPEVKTRMSTTGWVVFVILLICCFPLCLLGLLAREDYRVCGDCGIKVGGTG